jgi:hypothetical protein
MIARCNDDEGVPGAYESARPPLFGEIRKRALSAIHDLMRSANLSPADNKAQLPPA